MRSPSRRALVALLLLAMSLVVANRPGEAQSAITTGWWWKGNPGPTLPLPAGVPIVVLPAEPPALAEPPNATGGLMVAALPDGASSIAAIHAGVDAQSITLRPIENGDIGGMNAHLLACITIGGWQPTTAGRWDNKPIVACDLSNNGGSVAGIRNDDGSWVFPVAPLVSGGELDVAIVPAAGALPAGLLEPFQLVFAIPTLESFVINPPVPEVEEANEPTADEPFVDSFADDTGAGSGFETFGGDGSFAPIASAALPPAAQAPRRFAPVATTAQSDAGAQGLAVLLLLLVAGAAWMTSQQQLPAPISLIRVGARTRVGPPSAPTTGGLGRFERTRSGKPPSLF